MPKVQCQWATDGGISINISFQSDRPSTNVNFTRYEIHEFIGELDIPLEINGEIFYPKLIVKLFCDVNNQSARYAKEQYALERARAYSPLLQ